MNAFALICLLSCASSVSRPVTAAAVIDGGDVTGKTADDQTPPPPASATTAFHEFVAKGNELTDRYGFLLPKITSITLSGGLSLNLFSVMSVLPYVILALQKTNAPSRTAGPRLTPALENPENLTRFFADKRQGEAVIDAIERLAGPDASGSVDRLIENVKRSSTDAGGDKTGIDGEHLFRLLQRSDSLRELFRTERLTTEGTNLIDNFMNVMLNPELRHVKDQLVDGTKDARANPVSDTARAALDVGRAKANGMLRDLNSEVVGNVADWKSKSGDTTDGPYAGGLQNMIMNRTPDRVLTVFATANVLRNRYSHLIPKLATYFLPAGVGMDALKFVCLVTYVLIIAKQQNVIPEIEKGQIETLSGMNADKTITTLNNKGITKRIYPLEDYSNLGIGTIKLLASPEAMAVDNFIGELTKMKNEKGGDRALDKSTLFDLFKNSEFVRKLYAIGGFTDKKMKDYLGLDIGRLKNEIADEMNKNYTDGNQELGNGRLDPSAVPKTVTDALLATYRVCARKTNEQMVDRWKTVNERIQKLTARMTRASSSAPEGESAVDVPESLARSDLLGTTAAANGLATDSGTTDDNGDDKVIVETPND